MRFALLLFILAAVGCNVDFHPSSTSSALLATDRVSPDPQTDSLIAPYRGQMGARLSDTLSYLYEPFSNGRLGDSANLRLWTWACRLSLEAAPFADVCLLNSGGFRTSWQAGPLQVREIYEMMPFDNSLVVITLDSTGIAAMKAYLKEHPQPCYPPPLSLPDTDSLRVATTDYLANGGDSMDFLTRGIRRKSTGLLFRDAMIRAAEATDTLSVQL